MKTWKRLKSFSNGDCSCSLTESGSELRVQMSKMGKVIYEDFYQSPTEAFFNYEACVQEIEQWFNNF